MNSRLFKLDRRFIRLSKFLGIESATDCSHWANERSLPSTSARGSAAIAAKTRVYNRLQNLRSQATLVSATELEDPDTFVIYPEPSWGNLSLLELRQRLGLDRVLMGSKARSVFYRDRYLDGKGAKILADLLQSGGLDSNSALTISVLHRFKIPVCF